MFHGSHDTTRDVRRVPFLTNKEVKTMFKLINDMYSVLT